MRVLKKRKTVKKAENAKNTVLKNSRTKSIEKPISGRKKILTFKTSETAANTRSQLRLGKLADSKMDGPTRQLFTQWVDDDGAFSTKSLVKALDTNFIFDSKDGLQDLGKLF